MAENPPPDADDLRDDVHLLRTLIDAALDNGADHRLLHALSDVLRDRRERLEQLEQLEPYEQRYQPYEQYG
ncbi:MAG TPA: hypothetical protein VEY87_06590 [Gaiellaceae bacterium]|nr:hypothetical protein [Gaiellaceae bacterium]